jgi:hypothetical protein
MSSDVDDGRNILTPSGVGKNLSLYELLDPQSAL